MVLVCIPMAADEARHPPSLPRIPDRTFSVADYGARADDQADNTHALQSAIDAAAAAGGGAVEIPAGQFLCGPIRFASGINLRLAAGATLKMLPMNKYPGGSVDPRDFIGGKGLHDIAISGKGTIDGQGSPWWPLAKTTPGARRPRMIAFNGCERILIENVKLMNSPMFHIAISGKSTNTTVRGVTIRANPSTDPVNPSHNTDACDVSGSHILIEDCDISVGDDNFTCGGNTSDVLITHCTYGYGHGVSIGSYTNGGVSDITVEDCSFTNTECGIRIKSDRGRGGIVGNLTYRNLRMKNVGYPILIYASYMATERQYRNLNELTPEIAISYPAKPMGDRTPIYRDITFSNITATTAPGRRAGLIWGLPESPVTHIVLKDVSIQADKPFGIFNAEGVRVENCTITTPDGVNKLSEGNARVSVVPGQE
jgi:polygalacturonase